MLFKPKTSDETIEAICPGCNQKVTAEAKVNFVGMKMIDCPSCNHKFYLPLTRKILILYILICCYIVFDLYRIYGSVDRFWVTMDILILVAFFYAFLKHYTAIQPDQFTISKKINRPE
jgi:hypothetical protein